MRKGAAPAWVAELEAEAARLGLPLEPLAHGPTIARLGWGLARLDRYADQGVGRQGSGLAWLRGRIAADADVATGRVLPYGDRPPRPRHLAYWLPELLEQGRRWKHRWAPVIKDRRIAAGVRPPRRGRRR